MGCLRELWAGKERREGRGLTTEGVAVRPRPGSVELGFFGGTLERRGGALRVQRRRDVVEVAGADLALVLGGGVAAALRSELALLQVDAGGHALAGVAVRQVEHRVVQRVEAGQRD